MSPDLVKATVARPLVYDDCRYPPDKTCRINDSHRLISDLQIGMTPVGSRNESTPLAIRSNPSPELPPDGHRHTLVTGLA